MPPGADRRGAVFPDSDRARRSRSTGAARGGAIFAASGRRRAPRIAQGSKAASSGSTSSLAPATGRRLLYRFVSTSECEYWLAIAQAHWTKKLAQQADAALRKQLLALIAEEDFAETLHNFTLAKGGGGRGGPWLATTANIQKLIRSTDSVVQGIVRSAPWVLAFSVPQDACINAPSELSKSEAEVLVPNVPKALGHMLYKKARNIYKVTSTKSEKKTQE